MIFHSYVSLPEGMYISLCVCIASVMNQIPVVSPKFPMSSACCAATQAEAGPVLGAALSATTQVNCLSMSPYRKLLYFKAINRATIP